MRFLAMLALSLLAVQIRADVFDISASEQGWVCSPVGTAFCSASNNGASPANDYSAAAVSLPDNTNLTQFRNWFEFAIPALTGGSLVSATLSLDDGGHDGGDLTYDVYGLSGQPLVFTDVNSSGPFVGSVATSDASSATIITITLDAAALAAIGAAQGGNIFIGGIDSGESVTDPATVSPLDDFVGDFGSTLGDSFNTLTLTTAAATVPEPSSLLLLGSAALLAAWGARKSVKPRRERQS